MPAISNSRSEPSTCVSDNGWPFLSLAFISVEIRSSVGCFLRCSIWPAKYSGHLMDRAHQGVVILDAQFENFVDPFDEEIAVLFRNAEHVGDGANRDVLGVARRGVAFSLSDEFVDQLVADRANPRLQSFHGVGRERRQQQLLRGLVLRRIGGDRRRRSVISGRTSRTMTRREEKCSVS